MGKFLILIVFFSSFAWADLQVFPLRVVLSEKERNAQISVRHRGSKTTRYRITTVFYKMNPDGTMKELKKDQIKEKTAEPFFRYSPKQVVLEPNVEQVIRITLRMPSDLPEGDYRTHLHFEGVEDTTSPVPSGNPTGAVMTLKAQLAMAIPVIVRKGNPNYQVNLSNLKYVKTADQKPAFMVDMKTTGNAFPYGSFEVFSIVPGKEPKTIGIVNGVSSYVESRKVNFPLLEPPEIPGKIKVVFKKPVGDSFEILSSDEKDLK